MNHIHLIAALAISGFTGPMAAGLTHVYCPSAHAGDPVNAMCPIGKEPIVPSAGTIEYDGHTIGLCCPGCGKAFLVWDESRRDAFVAMAIRGEEPGHKRAVEQKTPAAPETKAAVAPYPLDTCIVGESKLGSMGDPIVKVYNGREVRFCCAGCIAQFEADQDGYFEKIDALIVRDQLRYYPMDMCVVTGEPLVEDGRVIGINIVHQERLVRLCCKGCVRRFNADPARYMAKLDIAVIATQRADYPIDTCVVAGGTLGSMGDPTEMIVAGRLMRFCCAACEPKAEADPMKYLGPIDKAWQAKGKFLHMPTEPRDHDQPADAPETEGVQHDDTLRVHQSRRSTPGRQHDQ